MTSDVRAGQLWEYRAGGTFDEFGFVLFVVGRPVEPDGPDKWVCQLVWLSRAYRDSFERQAGPVAEVKTWVLGASRNDADRWRLVA